MSGTHQLVPEDLYRIKLVGDPQIAPDGSQVAFVHQQVEGEAREYRAQIWVVPTSGGQARPLTQGMQNDTQPRWSPDGRYLAFVRQLGEGSAAERQIWLLPRAGGEAWQLTTMRYGASNPTWSPDGSYIAFSAPRQDDDNDEQAIKARTESERKQEEQTAKDEAKLITHFRYKSDTAGVTSPDRWDQVWVVAVPDLPVCSLADLPQPKAVTSGPYNHQLRGWSPDGKWVTVVCNRESELHNIADIWLFPTPVGDTAISGAAVKLTDSTGMFYDAAWHPSGTYLAVVGDHQEYRSATLSRLWLYAAPGCAAGGKDVPVCLTAGWDCGVGGMVAGDVRPAATERIAWSADGSRVFITASSRGATQLYQVNVAAARRAHAEYIPEAVTRGQREIYGFSVAGDQVAYTAAEIVNPGDIYTTNLRTGSEQRLTNSNADVLADVAWPEVQEIEFAGHADWPIHGWIMKPVGWQPGQRYPAVLQIHGGPHMSYGYTFYLEMQLQAAAGYVVIFVNPRGSASYGQEFIRACQGDYGGADYQDLLAAVDYGLSLGYVDADRLAVTGGSYGGFMTNWAITQTTRFQAAITHRSISNWLSFWGVSDIGPHFAAGEFQVESLWAGFDRLWERSPLQHVARVTTPLLICHSENDLRCPMEQAEQFYVALKWLGKEVEFLRHPRSTHELTRSGPPTLRVDRFQHIARFLGQHVPVRPEQYAS